jgi:hypothetical protein
MKFGNHTYTAVLFIVLIVCCLNVVNAINTPEIHYLKTVSVTNGDTIRVSKLSNFQEKIKLIHKPSENQVRIETDFPAADPLTGEIVNMIGVSCQKVNFRVSTTIDYTLKPGIYFVVVYFNKQRIFSSKILVSQ